MFYILGLIIAGITLWFKIDTGFQVMAYGTFVVWFLRLTMSLILLQRPVSGAFLSGAILPTMLSILGLYLLRRPQTGCSHSEKH